MSARGGPNIEFKLKSISDDFDAYLRGIVYLLKNMILSISPVFIFQKSHLLSAHFKKEIFNLFG